MIQTAQKTRDAMLSEREKLLATATAETRESMLKQRAKVIYCKLVQCQCVDDRVSSCVHVSLIASVDMSRPEMNLNEVIDFIMLSNVS